MKKLCLLVTLTCGVLAAGCELIVDFDRTKIVGEEVPETGAVDSATPTDSAPTDSASDSANDAGTDTGTDAAPDVADASDSG